MTSLLSALPSAPAPHDHAAGIERPMYANEPGSQADCYALRTILELREIEIAELKRKQQVQDLIRLEVTKTQIENRKLTARIAELERIAAPLLAPNLDVDRFYKDEEGE